jgi:tetratricopeptide (TPR) repeat protein
MLKDGFHRGRLGKICDPEEHDIEPSVMIAKMQLQLGLLKESEATLQKLDIESVQVLYTLGKVYFMMNRYEEALEAYRSV